MQHLQDSREDDASVKILFLGPDTSPVLEYLRGAEAAVEAASEPVSVETLEQVEPDFVVSHGYRHLVRPDVLERVQDRVINLHISLLPWNRGADPNVWSLIEGTPRGVTIHYIDEGVDTGDVIAQREVVFEEGATLRTSYETLQRELLDLFIENWPAIRDGRCPREKQEGDGTTHRISDLERIRHRLTRGWDTPVSELEPGG
jgi:methionyl-tRNA formyltransferase